MPTPIMPDEQLCLYAERRLFGSNVRPEGVSRIELHNGVLPSALRTYIKHKTGSEPELVHQENAREPIFYAQRTLFIPQYSGFGRRKRYEEMIQHYLRCTGKQIEFHSLDLEGDPRKANIAYDNYAYDFVKDLFLEKEAEKIRMVVFGPIKAVSAQAKVVESHSNEYVDCQVVEVQGKRILNIGYVYADQAGIIIDKMLREHEAAARRRSERDPLKLRFLMFGRVGGLAEGMARHRLVYPSSLIDQYDLLRERTFIYPMHNILAGDNGDSGAHLNVTSVLSETKELLEQARRVGCISVDMEVREVVEAINRGKRRYAPTLRVGFGFVGYVSDVPLDRDTLAIELESDEGEQAAVKQILTRGIA